MNIISKNQVQEENAKRYAFDKAYADVISKILDLNVQYSEAIANSEVQALISTADEKAAVIGFTDWKNNLEKKVEIAKRQKEQREANNS